MNLKWTKNALKISEKEFFDEIDRMLGILQLVKPKRFYVDTNNLSEILEGETLKLFLNKVVSVYKKIGLKKLSVYIGDDLFRQIFVSHVLEEERKIMPINAKYFKNKDEAKRWINE